MKTFVAALLLKIVIFAVTFQTGESIKCYSCNSKIDKKCGDPIDTNGMESMECTPTAMAEAAATLKKGFENFAAGFMGVDGVPSVPSKEIKFACQKIDISVTDKDGGSDLITTRSCTIAKTESANPCAMSDYLVKVTGGKGEVKFCDTCESDMCNGSSRQTFATLLLAVPCFAMFLSHWFNV